MANSGKFSCSKRTKHIKNRYFMIKDKIGRGEIISNISPRKICGQIKHQGTTRQLILQDARALDGCVRRLQRRRRTPKHARRPVAARSTGVRYFSRGTGPAAQGRGNAYVDGSSKEKPPERYKEDASHSGGVATAFDDKTNQAVIFSSQECGGGQWQCPGSRGQCPAYVRKGRAHRT